MVCRRRFILGSEGWGMLQPTNSTSEWPERTTLSRLPRVWSSLLNTQVAHRLSFSSWWMMSPSSFCPQSRISSRILDSSEGRSSSSDIICSESDIAIYYMLSTPFEHQIYLGYPTQQPLERPSFETTFLGGLPLFLETPEKKQLQCQNCPNQTLTFICQVFCPLPTPDSYNRVLYILFCQKCQREFKCLKQQSSEKQTADPPKIEVRTIQELPFFIQSEAMEAKELEKIKNKAKREVEQEIIEEKEEEQFDSDDEEVKVVDIKVNFEQLGLTKEEGFNEDIGEEKMAGLKVASEGMQETKKEEKDIVFEEYRKAMSELDGPILLYSNISVPYNSQPINPRHNCKHCKAKLILELQITEKMLSVSPKLVGLDWGTLLIFTCSKSCPGSTEECLVVQYETDAIQDSEVSALKKRHKNKKRKEKSKSKKEKKSEQKQESPIEQEKEQEKQQGDDWA